MRRALVLLLTLLLVEGLVACNSATGEPTPAATEVSEVEPVEEEAEPTEVPMEEPTEVPTEVPTEEPTATLTPEPTATVASTPTVPVIDPESNFPVGKLVWTASEEIYFVFRENGQWTQWGDEATGPDFQMNSGRFVVEGDIWTQTSNQFNCGTVPMSYRFTFDGTILTFEPTAQSMNDNCADRKQYFSSQTYVLSEE